MAALLFCLPAIAADSSPQATNALASFLLRPGFRIQLVAAEPLVTAPVAMAFDENGRLFVVELPDSPTRHDAGPLLGRVRRLEDPDEAGVFRTSTVYADSLPFPSAVACYAGGVFVAAGHEVLYLKDTHGNGSADVRKVVLTGFGGTNTLEPGALLNSFNWGLDNRIHGATAGIGGVITASNWPGKSVSLADSDFSFDPRTLAVLPEAGPAQSGLSFDNRGRKFLCDYARPLRLALYAPRYTARNPFYPKPPVLLDVASPATPIFRFVSMPLPQAKGAVRSATDESETGLPPVTNALAPMWLTDARGCAVYRGSLFPTNYSGNVFLAAPEAHAIHRLVLRDNGLEVSAGRAPEERAGEFLISRDPSFHPVQVIVGPEGALYIADQQNGHGRGRIYRIVPQSFHQPKPPQLGRDDSYDLVAALACPNGWQRDTAARLLFERHDPAAAPLLTNMLAKARLPLARLHALHALDALGALGEPQLLWALRDTDERVREHAVQLSERLLRGGTISNPLWAQLRKLAADPSIHVRYQLAFTLGQIRRPDKAVVLAEILNRDRANPWVQNAVLSSLADGAGNVFVLLANNAYFLKDPAGQEFLRRLALMIGTKGRLDEVTQVIHFIARAPLEPYQAFPLLSALGEGLRRTESSLALVDPQGTLQRLFAQALDALSDQTLPEFVRVEAFRLLAVSPFTYTDTGDWLLLLCNPQPLPALRSAAIATLGRYNDPRVVPDLLDHWAGLTPALRRQALTALLSHSSRVDAVLNAIESGRIPSTDLSSLHRDFLRTYRDLAISERAIRLLGPVPVRRPEAIERFKPALHLKGTSSHGRSLFLARCAGCHQLGGFGHPLGPNLLLARTKGKEKTLEAILEPNASVPSQYTTAVVETKEGENLVGIKCDDNQATITLRQSRGDNLVWPRLDIQSIQAQSWSLMPDDLQQGLSPQDLADLLDYLMTAPR